jgi:hypothetical protein
MAKEPKDLFQQVLGRITDLPGAHSALDGLNTLRERIDELQKRIRGLDALEERIASLERRMSAHEKEHKPSPAKPAERPKRTTAAAKKPAPKRSAGS